MMTGIYIFVYFLLLLHICSGLATTEDPAPPRKRHDEQADNFPYNAAIIKNNDLNTVCGAALIHKRWIITAASCVYMTKVEVVLGSQDLASPDVLERRLNIKPRDVQIHHKFDPKSLDNNIALIHLPHVKITKEIKPIRFAEKYADFFIGEDAIITGWDKTKKLFASDVKVLPNSDCQWKFEDIHPKEMCASEHRAIIDQLLDNGIGAGSPLVLLKYRKLIGIVSKTSWLLGSPVIFTRISSYNKWIHSIISDEDDYDDESSIICKLNAVIGGPATSNNKCK